MSETLLPKGWIATTLKDICYLNPKNDLADDLDVGFLPMSGVPVNFGEKNIFEIKKWAEVKKGYTHFADGDTIFAKITPCFENSKASIIEKFPNGYGSGSTEYFVLRPVSRLVNPKLLLGLVRTNEFLREGAANMSGSVGHKRVPKEFVENYIFPLSPIAEQQQIAQKLDELLAQVDTLKTRLNAIPKILKRFRQSVLAAAVSGRLTEEWRGSGEKWPEKKLREICLSISDGDHQAPPRADSGIPFLVISNVNKGFIDFSKVERWVPQYYFDELKDLRRPKRNDILYTVTGSFGIPVLVDTDQDFCFQRHIAILKPNADFLNYKFLFFLLGSSQAFKQADSVATGTAQRTVALNSLRDFEFGIPPLEEQTEIVRRVEQLFAYADQIEQRVKDAKARVNHLTQSILAKAFRGELTADWRAQNPELISGENSAAALLEKIKAERGVVATKKRVKK